MVTPGGYGYAAFGPDDVEDAQRGHPAVRLTPYAEARGLEYVDQALVGAFRPMVPVWREHVFNAMRGALPGGWYGLVQHELHELPIDRGGVVTQPGPLYAVKARYRDPDGALRVVTGISGWRELPEGPFEANAAWAPTTRAVVRVSETALLPQLVVRRRDRMVRSVDLGPHGLGGFGLVQHDVPGDLLTAIFSGPVGQVLASLPHHLVELHLGYGLVSLKRNGYVVADDELDHLAQAAGALAVGLRDVAAPLLAPRAFTDALPGPGEADPPPVPWFPMPEANWADGIRRVAEERSMADEDVVAFHQAFPTLAVPGVALGVVRGDIPGLGRFGRLLFTQQGPGTRGTTRGAVLLEADPAAPALPTGGRLVPETGQWAETLGGITAVWNHERVEGGYGSLPLIDAAARTLVHLGL